MASAIRRLPVTVISGYFQAGKSALLQHVVRSWTERRLAVIAPPESCVALEPHLPPCGRVVLFPASAEYETRYLGEMQWHIRSDLLVWVDRIARQQWAECLLIESPATCSPPLIAETFTFRDPSEYSLSDLARLDTLVTVLDAGEFQADYFSGNVLERGDGESDDTTASLLLAQQVEFANVLVLNKADRVSWHALDRLATLCHHLNPDAHILPARHGQVPPERIAATGLFDAYQTPRAAGWLQQLRGAYIPNSPKHRVVSFVYRARRPFHPQRLWQHIQGNWPGLVQCKGYLWLATRMEDVGGWAQCGPVCHVARLGRWWAEVPPDQWPTSPAARQRLERNWQWPYGDRRQELVCILLATDPAVLIRSLDSCLLTDEEMALGPDLWEQFPDPFPSWEGMTLTNVAARKTMIRNR